MKFLPDPKNPLDGWIQVPGAVWDEANKLLPDFAAAWDKSRPNERGTQLLHKIVDSTQTPFSFSEKKLPLYLCPNQGSAYYMTHWPFYMYLSTTYPADAQARRLTKRDWTDFYMLHEVLHWFTFDQPYLRRWTPMLERVYQDFVRKDPNFLAGKVWVPARKAGKCNDDHPAIYINMNNLLSHLHMNGIRRTILTQEEWEYAKQAERKFTGNERYYSASMEIVDAMSPKELTALVKEVTDNRVPPGCSVLLTEHSHK
jgi:hypothetical protein